MIVVAYKVKYSYHIDELIKTKKAHSEEQGPASGFYQRERVSPTELIL
jgi:hypothetical protein